MFMGFRDEKNDFYDLIISTMSKNMGITKSDVLKLGVLELAQKIEKKNGEIYYNNINYSELAKIKQERLIRRHKSIKRTEFKSRNLNLANIRRDIILFIREARAQNKNPKNIVLEYIKEVEEELKGGTTKYSKQALEDFENFKKHLDDNIDRLDRFVNFIEDKS